MLISYCGPMRISLIRTKVDAEKEPAFTAVSRRSGFCRKMSMLLSCSWELW